MDEEWLAGQFEQHRPRLRAVAYRMLGSLAEAEDAVQEAWLRLSRSDSASVANLGGWLTTVVARICLNLLRSRARRHEETLDFHVPDPVIERDGNAQPEDEALLSDAVGLAMLIVLDTLTPDERLAFVLHDTFQLPFGEIAMIVGRTPAAAKQLASRARRRVKDAEVPADRDPARQRQAVDAFLGAAREGDFGALVAVLHPGVLLRIDGGAQNREASMLLRGPGSVAGQAARGFRHLLADPGTGLLPVLVNGSPGAILTMNGEPAVVMGFTVADRKIAAISAIADPSRIRGLLDGAVSLPAPLSGGRG